MTAGLHVAVEDLTVRHAGRKLPALREVSLEWTPGERLLLLGPSGGGKSTLALCLNGIIPHSLAAHWEHGRVLLDGRDTLTTPLGDLTRRVGVLFQDPESQLVMLEVDDEIAFGLENHGVPRDGMRGRVRDARRTVGLEQDRTPARLDHLSGGAKQRVALAALLALEPAALVLDEPTANLDPAGARQVLAALAALAADRSRSLLLIEHRIDDVLPLVDRVAVLDGVGHVVLTGDPDSVFIEHEALLDALGIWTPQLGALARALDPQLDRLPRDAAETAAVVRQLWPVGWSGPTSRRPSTPRPLVDVRSVSYRYPRSRQAALQDVSLTLHAADFAAIVGANAAGKSTLGLLVAGALAPSDGAITLEGRDLRCLREPELRRRLAYVFQYPEHQFVAATVRGELLYSARTHGLARGEAARDVDALLDRFGLAALAEASPYLLSHGQKRRLSVATALVSDPDLLVLDEPTFGQDRRHTETLMDFLHELNREGRTILLITHDMALVAEHVDRVIALAAGRVRFDGTPHDLFARDDVLAACSLRRPPVGEAFALARRNRPDLPAVIGLAEARAALGVA